jgi:hypothetical protein
MSVQALAWAIEDAPGVPAELVSLLIGLANHADETGRGAWPSLALLAEYTRKSERQVRRGLRELELLGLIRPGDQRITGHIRPDRRPPVYDLSMERAGARLAARIAQQAEQGTGQQREVTDVLPLPERGDAHDRSSVSRGDIQGRHGGTPTSPKPYLEPSTKNPLPPAAPRPGAEIQTATATATATVGPGAAIGRPAQPASAAPPGCSRENPAHQNCRACGTTRRQLADAARRVAAQPSPLCGECDNGWIMTAGPDGQDLAAKCPTCRSPTQQPVAQAI